MLDAPPHDCSYGSEFSERPAARRGCFDVRSGGERCEAESCTLLPSLEWLLKALTVFGCR